MLAVAGAAYYWLILESGAPAGTYALDLKEVRRLADTLAGPRVTEIHVEHVAPVNFPPPTRRGRGRRLEDQADDGLFLQARLRRLQFGADRHRTDGARRGLDGKRRSMPRRCKAFAAGSNTPSSWS
ncbi:MAG: hypothetical protein WDM81_16390 [Rhizomicrobium sp.]